MAVIYKEKAQARFGLEPFSHYSADVTTVAAALQSGF